MKTIFLSTAALLVGLLITGFQVNTKHADVTKE